MSGIKVEKLNDKLVISWLLSKIEVPISDIVKVTFDDTYGGEEKTAIRIGTPYGATDRLVILTHSNTYILFTTDAISIKNKIFSFINEQLQQK
ncbi:MULTISPECIES: hypothetical protein [Geobacillus]|jgi:hypothetical protein|nr:MULTISPECIES: hypothetical protein [Geobacillus]ARA98710.1 hypothetical protein GD3902_12190 [Geobacillus thermodenitrificans]ARP43900.1 hypothetical protein GTHT12_02380 [Geobacillus thermodenitrificans]ATO38065.1 hypothetical protein GTID1_13270 [Geobacillus thermodenitrificans]KQB92211.1 UPF0457 protein [Geobacillus sp. PA-3]MED0662937.1 hypothetical protein [Geobacillus thermodenitrificans]